MASSSKAPVKSKDEPQQPRIFISSEQELDATQARTLIRTLKACPELHSTDVPFGPSSYTQVSMKTERAVLQKVLSRYKNACKNFKTWQYMHKVDKLLDDIDSLNPLPAIAQLQQSLQYVAEAARTLKSRLPTRNSVAELERCIVVSCHLYKEIHRQSLQAVQFAMATMSFNPHPLNNPILFLASRISILAQDFATSFSRDVYPLIHLLFSALALEHAPPHPVHSVLPEDLAAAIQLDEMCANTMQSSSVLTESLESLAIPLAAPLPPAAANLPQRAAQKLQPGPKQKEPIAVVKKEKEEEEKQQKEQYQKTIPKKASQDKTVPSEQKPKQHHQNVTKRKQEEISTGEEEELQKQKQTQSIPKQAPPKEKPQSAPNPAKKKKIKQEV